MANYNSQFTGRELDAAVKSAKSVPAGTLLKSNAESVIIAATENVDYATPGYVDTHGGKIDVIKKNGTALTITDKAVNITVPTGAAADKGVDTSIAAGSTSTNLPTSKAVATFVEGKGYLTAHQDISGKQDKSTLETDVAAKGFTKNTGTVTSVAVKMNGTTKGTVTTTGTIDLGTVITAHQDISGKENISNKVTTIASTSTDTQYPSAKAVYTAINNAIGAAIAAAY